MRAVGKRAGRRGVGRSPAIAKIAGAAVVCAAIVIPARAFPSPESLERKFERELGRADPNPATPDQCKALEAAILSEQRRWEHTAHGPHPGGWANYPSQPRAGGGSAAGFEPFGWNRGATMDGSAWPSYRSYLQRCR